MIYSTAKSVKYVLILTLVSSFFVMIYWNIQLIFNGVLKPLYSSAEMVTRLKPHHNKSSRLNSRCVAMFNIGYRNNEDFKNEDIDLSLTRATARLIQAKQEFGQETEHYLPFTKSLVKLVDTKYDQSLKFINGTRLQIMKGKLPYVPCSIKDYSNKDFHECVKVRKERNEPLWIAYFGDSKARNMLFYLLNNTHSFMNWTIDGNNTFTENDYFPYAHFQTRKPIMIESPLGARLSLIVSFYGTFSAKNNPPLAADVLLEWLNQKEPDSLPDLLIVEFGTWYFLKNEIEHNSKHAFLIHTWNRLRTVLRKLSKRITIICHITTRVRESGVKRHVKMFLKDETNQGRILSDIMIKASTSYIDQVMLHGIRRSNMIFWDSTLPFNIAADLECQLLVKHNHLVIEAEAKQQKWLLPFMCNDFGHKTRATIHDETAILLNLACNTFVNNQPDYCCAQ